MGEGVRRRVEEKEEGGCINFRLFLEPVRTMCLGSCASDGAEDPWPLLLIPILPRAGRFCFTLNKSALRYQRCLDTFNPENPSF